MPPTSSLDVGPYGLTKLDGLDAADISKAKVPEGSRLRNVASARAYYDALKRDDSLRNNGRAKVQGVADGVPPYNQAMLNQAGQGSRCNLNFGDMDRHLNIAVAGYVDLANAVETLVQVDLAGVKEHGEKYFHEANINTEITHAFRSWGGFYPSYLRLASTFVLHGAGFAIFPNQIDWRYKSCGLSDFFFPATTPAMPEAIEMPVWQYDCPVTELYRYIEDEKAAEALGWNVNAVKAAIASADTNDKSIGDGWDWEATQRRIKNGDFNMATATASVRLIFTWPLEAGGTRSFAVATAAVGRHSVGPNDDFLYFAANAIPADRPAFVPFVYGVGSNGTYHSIRGLGQRLFSHAQTINRLRCQAVDGAMLSSSMLVQPSSHDQLAKMQMAHLGGITAVTPGITFVERGFAPDMTKSVIPAIAELTGTMDQTTDFYSNHGAANGSPYRSRLQVEAELESATRLTSASISLFYAAWTPLLREMTRRLIEGPKSDPAVREFYRRLEEKGTPAAVVRLVDHAKTKAVRAVGAGDSAARTAAYNDLEAIAPHLPEDGRKNLVFDRVANRVGYDAAKRYASPADVPRPTIDAKLAELENNDLLEGTPITVQSNELHGEHLTKHLPVIQQITEGIDNGTVDAMKVLNGLTLLHEHSFTHVQLLAADPWSQPVVANAKEVLQRAGEQILNYTRRAQAEAQEAAQGGDAAAGQQAQDFEAEAKRFEGELKLKLAELKVREKELDIEREERRHQQRMQIEDKKGAASLMKTAGLTGGV